MGFETGDSVPFQVNLYPKLSELLFGHRTRRTGHQIRSLGRFRKGHAVADIVDSGKEHDEPIKAQSNPPVGGGTELQRIKKEAKLPLRLFTSHSQQGKDAVLRLGVMDTDRPAADFKPVQDKVVCLCTDPPGIGFEKFEVFDQRSGER